MGVGEQIAKEPEGESLQGLAFRPVSCRRDSNLGVTEDNFDNIRPKQPVTIVQIEDKSGSRACSVIISHSYQEFYKLTISDTLHA